MGDVKTIYHNNFGAAFEWKRNEAKKTGKIQFVFNNTGLYLSTSDFIKFLDNIESALNRYCLCKDCIENNPENLNLLETPNADLSFAMTENELKGIKDLIKGAMFHLGLESLLRSQNMYYN